MVCDIVRDVLFLRLRSEDARKGDIPVGKDLRDTLNANRSRCVGLAGNMIGVRKRIIIVSLGEKDELMFNPVITTESGSYQAEEGCLSLEGLRRTKRWEKIEVEYRDEFWKKQKRTFVGLPAQIIQHEMDHLDGILI